MHSVKIRLLFNTAVSSRSSRVTTALYRQQNTVPGVFLTFAVIQRSANPVILNFVRWRLIFWVFSIAIRLCEPQKFVVGPVFALKMCASLFLTLTLSLLMSYIYIYIVEP
jgi:hypothetical protein